VPLTSVAVARRQYKFSQQIPHYLLSKHKLITMLALKKKREAEKKKAEEEAAAKPADAPAAVESGDKNKVSLFGIGGQKKNKKGEQAGTRKTPGEIRIQKG
jgi:hypothetical protein